jgi:hypothetical protein
VRLQAEVGWKVGGDETRGPRVHEESVDGQTDRDRQAGCKGQLLYKGQVAVELQDTGARCLTRFFADQKA